MKLTNDYRLEKLDEMNLVLQKKMIPETGKKKGQEQWKNIRYYPSYEVALTDVVELSLFDVGIENDLFQLRAKISELKSLYMRLGKTMDERSMR